MNRALTKSFLVLWTASLLACGGENQEAVEEEGKEDEGVAVEVSVVKSEQFPRQISFSSSIEAWEKAYITGPAGVRIEQIYVDEGDRVKKGQLLAAMSPTQLEQAEEQLELAKREVNRLDTLEEIGAVSGQQLDQARTQYQTALSAFRNQRQNTRLTANFSGVVTNKFFSVGETFSPSANAPAILTIADIEPVKITVNISETYYPRITQGMKASVTLDIFPDTTFSGEVYKKFPTIEEATRTFKTEIMIDNPENLLRPGMFARVTLSLDEVEGIYIPTSAVVNQPATADQYAFVKKGSHVSRKKIKTGNLFKDMIYVGSGLEAGDTIVTEGVAKLTEGMKIRVMNTGTSNSQSKNN